MSAVGIALEKGFLSEKVESTRGGIRYAIRTVVIKRVIGLVVVAGVFMLVAFGLTYSGMLSQRENVQRIKVLGAQDIMETEVEQITRSMQLQGVLGSVLEYQVESLRTFNRLQEFANDKQQQIEKLISGLDPIVQSKLMKQFLSISEYIKSEIADKVSEYKQQETDVNSMQKRVALDQSELLLEMQDKLTTERLEPLETLMNKVFLLLDTSMEPIELNSKCIGLLLTAADDLYEEKISRAQATAFFNSKIRPCFIGSVPLEVENKLSQAKSADELALLLDDIRDAARLGTSRVALDTIQKRYEAALDQSALDFESTDTKVARIAETKVIQEAIRSLLDIQTLVAQGRLDGSVFHAY